MFQKKKSKRKASATPKSGFLSYILSALPLWGILARGISCRYVLTVQKKKSMQNCIRNLIKLCAGINSFLFSCKALRGLCCSDYLSTSFGGMSI